MGETETQIENIRTLYQEAQRDRRRLSQTIVRSIGYAIIVNAGIWAFFVKEYIELAYRAWYLFATALLCSLVVILWRWYTHFLDNRLANLYPELLDYETRLDPSWGGPTWTHLEQLVFRKCTEQEKKELRNKAAIRSLVDQRRIGWRGHGMIDILVAVYLVLMWLNTMILGMILGHEYLAGISLICLVVFLIAFGCLVARCAQTNPSEEDVRAVTIYDCERQRAVESKPPQNPQG